MPPWSCAQCTLENDPSATICAACELPRPHTADPSPAEQKLLGEFRDQLVARGIKCVVFDMDKTLVSMHSQGSLPRSKLDAYIQSVSPVCRALLPLLIKCGIRIAIATFSDDLYTSGIAGFPSSDSSDRVSGAQLTQSVLSSFLDPKVLSQIPIITLNPALYPPKVPEKDPRRDFLRAKVLTIGDRSGIHGKDLERFVHLCNKYPPMAHKLWHLHVIVNLLDLDFKDLCLIDDSDDNVTSALKMGSVGVKVPLRQGLAWADLAIYTSESLR